MSGCTFLKDIYGWVWFFGKLLWVGVSVYRIFVGACDSLEHFYGWVWVGVTGCDWVWVSVTGCGWVGKMVKPILFTYFTNKNLCLSFFLIKNSFFLLKTDADTGAFLWNLQSFKNNFYTEHLRWLLLKIMKSNNYLRVLPIFATTILPILLTI